MDLFLPEKYLILTDMVKRLLSLPDTVKYSRKREENKNPEIKFWKSHTFDP